MPMDPRTMALLQQFAQQQQAPAPQPTPPSIEQLVDSSNNGEVQGGYGQPGSQYENQLVPAQPVAPPVEQYGSGADALAQLLEGMIGMGQQHQVPNTSRGGGSPFPRG